MGNCAICDDHTELDKPLQTEKKTTNIMVSTEVKPHQNVATRIELESQDSKDEIKHKLIVDNYHHCGNSNDIKSDNVVSDGKDEDDD